ncbi:MAG: exopolysaccharide biosynthesis polyprenyl glycosylphosphotransferase [Candidatus Marinimicrobia bacterium]|nr:exopolysaccharide biosynthesis polyprenyl glycosylphosphotransferase [Candidatus Neomarinimicrobiota bacterium]
MTSPRRAFLMFLLKLSDLLVMSCCFVAIIAFLYSAPYSMSLHSFLEMRLSVTNFLIILFLLFAWNRIFIIFGLYESRRMSAKKDEILDILKSVATGTLVIYVVGLLADISLITPQFILLFFVLASALNIAVRMGMRFFLKLLRERGRNIRYITIIGTNERALKLAEDLRCRPELGYHVNGFVDEEWAGSKEVTKAGYTIVSSLNEFPQYLRDNVVDEVAVTLPVRSYYEESSKIVRYCQEQGINIRVLPDVYARQTNGNNGNGKLKQYQDLNIGLVEKKVDGASLLIKRMMDLFLSFTAIIALSPLFIAIAAAIKITSRGPVFFIQERVGLRKRHFKLFKFRTMVQDAEEKIRELEEQNEMDGPVFKIKDDPRITKVGKFLRKTSLDELPQLFNVLKGDMSLVGPRPLPIRDYNGFSKDWHRRRFSVKPGITCLWQTSGRNDISFERWMELDMKYIDEWSLVLDMKILIKTIPAVLDGSGA